MIWTRSHWKATLDSFFSGVRLVNAYVTGTFGKYFKTAHCMVSLYRSVSRKEMTPSGKGEEPLKSILTRGLCLEAFERVSHDVM